MDTRLQIIASDVYQLPPVVKEGEISKERKWKGKETTLKNRRPMGKTAGTTGKQIEWKELD